MLDVVPPQQAPRSGRMPGRGQKRTTSRQPVVELPWRLPARLRRPVRQELARQRQKRQQRESIVRFERRPLYTASSQNPPFAKASGGKPAASRPATGAEQHTGDVYRDNRPRLAATIPPYAGSFLQGKSRSLASPPQQIVKTKKAITKIPAKPMPSIIAGERDIPYQWDQKTPARSQFALPLHVSLWPFKRSRATQTDKKKVQNSDSLTL